MPFVRTVADGKLLDWQKYVDQFDIVVSDFLAVSRAVMSLTTDQLVVYFPSQFRADPGPFYTPISIAWSGQARSCRLGDVYSRLRS
jgi:hypothetical protein